MAASSPAGHALNPHFARATEPVAISLRAQGKQCDNVVSDHKDRPAWSATVASSTVSPNLVVDCIDSLADFRALHGEWAGLYQRCEDVTPFNSWDWLFSWWQSYGVGHRLRIVTVRRDGQLVGAMPLSLRSEPGPLGMRCRVMRFVGDGSSDSDYLRWLVATEDDAGVAAALITWLRTNAEWDALVLRELPAKCAMPDQLKAAADAQGWLMRQESGQCGIVDLPGSFDAFLQGRQSRFRTKLRSLLKKVDQGSVEFERDADPATLRVRLRSLFSLHQARWQGAGKPGVFGDRQKRLFYARFAPRYLRKRWLRLYSLRRDGNYVAHQLCFEDRGVVYLLQEGFDVSDPSSSYGQMLRAAVIRHLISVGVSRYDFLGGLSRHKEGWGAEEQLTTHVIITRASLRGRAYFRGPLVREHCARWAHALLPAKAIAWLKRTIGERG